MREIKFRLRIGDEIVGWEKWYSGHQIEGDPCSANPCWLYSRDGERWNPTFIPHTDKDQFTLSYDTKTHKEIYEKDMCRQTFNHKTSVGEVRFSPSQGWLVGNWPLWPHDIEIIGDAFQNKDLLEKKP